MTVRFKLDLLMPAGPAPHPTDVEIGEALQTLRLAREMPIDQLTDSLGLDAAMLERVESGVRPLLAREMLWILAILGAPLSLSTHIGVRTNPGA